MDESMYSLQKGIERRQQELHTAASTIAKAAMSLTRISNILKVVTITLGSLTAAKGALDTIIGPSNAAISLAIFTLFGVAIAVSAGVEAAFKFEKRGAALTELAATCHTMVRWVDTEWRNRIGSNAGTDQRDAARTIISSADEKIARAQSDAAKLGLNIAAHVYTNEFEYREIVSA